MPTPPPDALEPWDRRAGEGPVAFSAFTEYRDAGASRSLRKLAALSREREGRVYVLSQVAEWSRLNDWVDRSEAWDDYLDRQSRLEQVDQVRNMRRVHAAVASTMVAKAAEKLRNIVPDKLSIRDAFLLFELGVKVERLARGEPDLVIDHEGRAVDRRPEPTGHDILEALAANPDLADFASQLSGVLDFPDE